LLNDEYSEKKIFSPVYSWWEGSHTKRTKVLVIKSSFDIS